MEQGAVGQREHAASAPETARQRAKQQRRQSILVAAQRRFAELGYAATTCEDIARDAGLSPRTFYAYFPTKDDLLFASDDDDLARLATRLAGRGPGESALDVVQEMATAWTGADATEAELLRARLLAASPALAARESAQLLRFRDVIAAAVNADLGLPGDDVRGEVVAAALTATWSVSQARLLTGRLTADQLPDLLDDAFRFVRAGVDALTAATTATHDARTPAGSRS